MLDQAEPKTSIPIMLAPDHQGTTCPTENCEVYGAYQETDWLSYWEKIQWPVRDVKRNQIGRRDREAYDSGAATELSAVATDAQETFQSATEG